MSSSTRVKRWMTCIGISGFVAGIAVGSCLPSVFASSDATGGDAWLLKAEQRYGLSSEQVREMRAVLFIRDRRIKAVLMRNYEHIPAQDRARIAQENRQADKRIEVILDEVQLAQYRKDKNPSKQESGDRTPARNR